MATSLDVPLDDLIKSRSGRGRGRGRGQGGGRGRGDGQRLARGSWRGRGAGTFRGRERTGVPSRRPLGVNTRSSSFVIAKARTKLSLFLSIPRIQITELFSEMGHLKHCAVHYDSNRRPTGSAEVIFTRRSEALQALKRYNNVRLDGKPMKIEVIGADTRLSAASATRVSVVPGARGRGQREVVMMYALFCKWKHGGLAQRGGGEGRGRARGRGRSFGQGRGRGYYVRKAPVEKSAEQLDKELDNYHSGAMNVD
ncbi:hypothetical protein PR202_ga17287 [Eleusine coracana subsp. coracana]|uniref:RRM domain-containing protein n=1 Tax=Eleusine coracana subsp. coracana TaxID=191504 RepID=A0AAV5CPW4_ELECO|nr:hypothetical protein PR202_ga17287 [Eleusine coracana subsp. coracana]